MGSSTTKGSRGNWRVSFRLATLSFAAVGSLLLGGLPATAAPTVAGSDSPVDTTTIKLPDYGANLAEYWTPERMRKTVREAQARGTLEPAPTAPPSVQVEQPQADGPPTTLAPPEEPQTPPVGPSITRLPAAPTVGKVFFYNPYLQQNRVCSASVLNSQNKNMVLTAGHCIVKKRATMKRWIFVPGYNYGNAPYGSWKAQYATMPTPWSEHQIYEYDVALMTMYPSNGQEVANVVGANGIIVNHQFPQVAVWGYPAEDPYDGRTQYYCLNRQTYEAPVLRVKTGCPMTGGASGGPWFQDFNTNVLRGYAIGVTSTSAQPEGYIASPYFGGYMVDVYNEAKVL